MVQLTRNFTWWIHSYFILVVFSADFAALGVSKRNEKWEEQEL